MPLSAPKPCATPGCRSLVRGRAYCDGCQGKRDAARAARPPFVPRYPVKKKRDPRKSAHARGYGRTWRAYRVEYLKANPFCWKCGEPATVVDHIKAHKGDEQLFWDEANHRPSCKPHHDERVDEGDFGRKHVDQPF